MAIEVQLAPANATSVFNHARPLTERPRFGTTLERLWRLACCNFRFYLDPAGVKKC